MKLRHILVIALTLSMLEGLLPVFTFAITLSDATSAALLSLGPAN